MQLIIIHIKNAKYLKYLTKEKKTPDMKYIGSATTLEKQRRARKIVRLLFLMSMNKQMRREADEKKTRAARFAQNEVLKAFPCVHLYAHHYIC